MSCHPDGPTVDLLNHIFGDSQLTDAAPYRVRKQLAEEGLEAEKLA
jgi:hypothetical protein